MDALQEIAEKLLNCPDSETHRAGLYYSAMVAKRRGEEWRAIELLSQISTPRAIQTLGAIEFEAGRYDAALPLFIRAAQAAKGNDLATGLSAMNQVSFIKSIAGEHQKALDDL